MAAAANAGTAEPKPPPPTTASLIPLSLAAPPKIPLAFLGASSSLSNVDSKSAAPIWLSSLS